MNNDSNKKNLQKQQDDDDDEITKTQTKMSALEIEDDDDDVRHHDEHQDNDDTNKKQQQYHHHHHQEQKELHIAPMLDFSKREFRKLFSILSKRVVVWTDMAVDETICYSKRLEDLLGPADTTVPNKQICQIGGNSPALCEQAVRKLITSDLYPYDEINLNIDCPSDRVSNEREFGAILMTKVDLTLQVLQGMKQGAATTAGAATTTNTKEGVPISVKCRIGVDDWDDLEFVSNFVKRLLPVCNRFYLHARKCVLTGLLNCRQNRSIPPLNYPRVYELCRQFPTVDFWINGGIRTLVDAKAICYGIVGGEKEEDTIQHHQVNNGSCTAPLPPELVPPNLRGCMMGRAALDHPALFANVDRYFYGLPENPCRNRRQVLEEYCTYLEEELYPRRCCDTDDTIMTYQLPVPKVRRIAKYCDICEVIYRKPKTSNNNNNDDDDNDKMPTSKQKIIPNKMSSRLIGRALKPVRGLFYGLPGSKVFLHACDRLSKDRSLCNCGPGFILRMAMKAVPDELLDQEF